MIGHRKLSGFTLLELVITLFIFSLLVFAAVPTFEAAIASNKLANSSNLLKTAVHLTRSEAIKSGHRVVLCLLNADQKCSTLTGQTLIVFHDEDRTGSPSSQNDVVFSENLDDDSLDIRYNRTFLAFSPLGYASGTNGTFTLCGQRTKGSMIIVSTLGRTRKAVDYDDDGFVEKTPGDPISCS